MAMKKINSKYSFQQFNSEINELYEYLKSEKYKEEEIKKIFSPLTSKIQKSFSSTHFFFWMILLLSLVYLSTYFDTVYWHVSAIGRIILIKSLPFFDWRYLKNKPCLVDKFTTSNIPQNLFLNCDLCENIKNIHVYEDIDEDTLTQRYLELDVPLILTRGLEKWPNSSSFVTDLLRNDAFYHSYPCKLSSNIYKGSTDIGEVLKKIKLFDEFFIHFQNCELQAMKVFRRFTYRPDYLPGMYSPILYNWLIWNKDYNTTNYKIIDLEEKVTVFGQLFGDSYIKLNPRLNCRDICPVLDIILQNGESLVFTNLWDLEYRPKETGENMAVILEMKD